jgi:hypothetical protein
VFDPTRWQFEANGPYIYTGSAEDYDEGGNRFRGKMYVDRPLPPYDPEERQCEVDFGDATGFVEGILCHFGPPGTYSMSQLFYVANMPYDALGEWPGVIYAALEEAHLGALVPIDNRTMAEREFGAGG